MMDQIADFFSREAGQRRRAWLDGLGAGAAEAARYYLGPSGLDQRLGAAGQLAAMFSPGADMMDAASASGDMMRAGSPMEAATAGAAMAGALGSMFIPGNARAAGEALTRFGADEAGALMLPPFKVRPQPGQGFDDWLDLVYDAANRGPDNKTVFPDVFYRGVDDFELQQSLASGQFASRGEGLFVEPDPSRYIGGGAYGAKRGGSILQFDTSGLAPLPLKSLHVPGLAEHGFQSVPVDRVRAAWRWSPQARQHILLDEAQLGDFLRPK
jgi:hypothetical protein